MNISKDLIAQILDRISLVEVVGEQIPLERKGKHYLARCPFHHEKTPSFTIFTESGRFQCFGCGEKGDAISFLMKREGLPFPEVVKRLAERAGIALPISQMDSVTQSHKNRGYSLHKIAATYFAQALLSPAGAVALAYLHETRGLPIQVIKELGLGFAPNSFDSLKNYLLKQGFSEDELLSYALCKKGTRGQTYDAFRNRVMFPIEDIHGNIVAFGGRALDNTRPKYLNSSETPLFHKGQHLYGLCRAKKSNAEQLILCEGYLDVITLHAAGITNAVAPLGTALTMEQATLLKKHTRRVLLNFDSDNAGLCATERALSILDKVGVPAKVVTLEKAKDPDEFIKTFGKDAYIQVLARGAPGFLFRMNRVLSKYDLSKLDEKIQGAKAVVALIAESPSAIIRDIYADLASGHLGISKEALLSDVTHLLHSK